MVERRDDPADARTLVRFLAGQPGMPERLLDEHQAGPNGRHCMECTDRGVHRVLHPCVFHWGATEALRLRTKP